MVYDAAGNPTQKCEGANVNVTNIPFTACSGTTNSTYTYDPLNRMSAATVTGAPNHSFTYDDQGRRLSKTAGATTTHYLYNGQDILAEYQGTWSAALAHLTHGPGTDEPLQRLQGAAAVHFMQDGLGSVVAAVPHTDVNNGANAAFQMFDAWGNRTQGSGTVANYGYTGREPDATGLIYYRARYYDPSIQRFTQRDPIGVAGGVNAYAYVGNSPVMLTDPSGTIPAGGSNTGGNAYPVEGNANCGPVADGAVFPPLFPAGSGETPALRDRYYFMYAMASAAGGVRSDAVGNHVSGLEDSDASSTRNEILADNIQLYCGNLQAMGSSQTNPKIAQMLGAVTQHLQNSVDAAKSSSFSDGLLKILQGALPSAAVGVGMTSRVAGRLASKEVTVFAGHGVESAFAGTTIVPQGVALTLPGRAGVMIPDELGRLMEAGKWVEIAANSRYAALMEGSTTYLPGAVVPNLILQPAGGLVTLKGTVTVATDTKLATLLDGARGVCVWAACRYVPGGF